MPKQTLHEFCLQNDRKDLLEQWQVERNSDVTPNDVTVGSHQKVWWRCEKGHEWEAPVYSRTSGNMGCPYCAGKRVWPGDDLASHHPELATQWNNARNGSLRPDQMLDGSHRKVWWRCDKGHEWKSTVAHRAFSNAGCPYCAGRLVLPGFNDLKSQEPEIAAQWHPALNGKMTPDMVTVGSGKRVWWECPFGHVWRAVIYSRTGKSKCGCPICAGIGTPRRKYGKL